MKIKLCSGLLVWMIVGLVSTAWAAPLSPIGTWRLQTKTQVTVKTANNVVKKSSVILGNEYVSFYSDVYRSTDWINQLRLYAVFGSDIEQKTLEVFGHWVITKEGYSVTYDPTLLNFTNKQGKSINTPFLSRTGYVGLLTQALGSAPANPSLRIVSYVDNGKVTKKGWANQGAKKTTLWAYWTDSDNKQQFADVTVNVTYTGTRFDRNTLHGTDCCVTDNGEKNLADSQAYLLDIDKQAGIHKTASGLRYMILQEGGGTPPAKTDKVLVNYFGAYPSGAKFDEGSLAVFALVDANGNNSIIDGWVEGLQLMAPGAKYRFFIPPSLAYGETGFVTASSQVIVGPNAVLIFDVELVEVVH